jgi:hypothetical protein
LLIRDLLQPTVRNRGGHAELTHEVPDRPAELAGHSVWARAATRSSAFDSGHFIAEDSIDEMVAAINRFYDTRVVGAS